MAVKPPWLLKSTIDLEPGDIETSGKVKINAFPDETPYSKQVLEEQPEGLADEPTPVEVQLSAKTVQPPPGWGKPALKTIPEVGTVNIGPEQAEKIADGLKKKPYLLHKLDEMVAKKQAIAMDLPVDTSTDDGVFSPSTKSYYDPKTGTTYNADGEPISMQFVPLGSYAPKPKPAPKPVSKLHVHKLVDKWAWEFIIEVTLPDLFYTAHKWEVSNDMIIDHPLLGKKGVKSLAETFQEIFQYVLNAYPDEHNPEKLMNHFLAPIFQTA